ncbi:hypothetical protein GmHk_04G010991 [Glycine max]|nr:hypothetical protein GmHk_04G010991 [Glycine max]
MRRNVFLCTVQAFGNDDQYFQSSVNVAIRMGLSLSKKCIATICILAYGSPTDSVSNMVFSGVLGSIDCMHWEWKNYLVAQKGQFYREEARKDLEHIFGVLQSRFTIVCGTMRASKMNTIKHILYACIYCITRL